MEPEIQLLLSSIKEYFNAFEKSRLEDALTQAQIAEHCDIRASTLSTLFQYFRGKKTDEEVTFNKGALASVLRKFKAASTIEASFLKLSGDAVARKKDTAPVIIPYPNYDSANVAAAVSKAGKEICLLNTYLATKLFNEEASDDDENTLKNWILRRNKKIRLLLLRPDGKAMRLRTKTDLGQSSAKLASHIINGLEMVLKLKEQYPKQLEVRLMDELPGMACVILEDRLFYGLHYSFGHAEGGPVFEINNSAHYTYKKIKEHFDTLWSADRSQELNHALLNQVRNAVQVVYNRLEYLLGGWNMFLHKLEDVYKGEGPAPNRSLGEGVDRFLLDINKNDRDIYPQAVLTLPNLERLTGSLVTEHLQDRDYAHIRFTDHNRLCIHLSIYCRFEGKNAPFCGFFTMSSGSDACTGLAILSRKENGVQISPSIIPVALKRQLAFADGAFISLERVRNNINAFNEPFKYAGVYKVYSYGGKEDNAKCIKINWLYINEYGEAQYKNQHFNSNSTSGILSGRATEINKNTHIVFTGFREQKRRGYLIIHTTDVGTDYDQTRYYSGVHLGISWDKQMPTGKRFLLELTDKKFAEVEPDLVPLHSDEYHKIPEPLRKLLSGRVKNLLGFLRQKGQIFTLRDIEREWEQSIQMSEVFFDSACMLAKRGNPEKSANMLLRAVNHGFYEIKRFEDEVKSMSPDVLKKIQATKDYEKIQATFPNSEAST